jgi:O-antigen ligase
MSNRLSPSTIREHANIRIGATYLFFEMIKDYPITGLGFGLQTYDNSDILAKYNARVPLQFRQEPPIRIPHNLFTDVTIRLGFVGLAFFIFILYRFLHTGWDLVKYGRNIFIQNWSLCLLGAFFAFLVNGMAMDATFGIQAVVFYSLLAMMTILWRLNRLPEISRKEK